MILQLLSYGAGVCMARSEQAHLSAHEPSTLPLHNAPPHGLAQQASRRQGQEVEVSKQRQHTGELCFPAVPRLGPALLAYGPALLAFADVRVLICAREPLRRIELHWEMRMGSHGINWSFMSTDSLDTSHTNIHLILMVIAYPALSG